MSAIGTKQTSIPTLNMSAFGGKADISDRLAECPLMTQSGHGGDTTVPGGVTGYPVRLLRLGLL